MMRLARTWPWPSRLRWTSRSTNLLFLRRVIPWPEYIMGRHNRIASRQGKHWILMVFTTLIQTQALARDYFDDVKESGLRCSCSIEGRFELSNGSHELANTLSQSLSSKGKKLYCSSH